MPPIEYVERCEGLGHERRGVEFERKGVEFERRGLDYDRRGVEFERRCAEFDQGVLNLKGEGGLVMKGFGTSGEGMIGISSGNHPLGQ
ncbi:hypothetical protein MA16_Dca005092 [Dendrobium catenatum]|uniref:Uncharacterized protein n=1 Tax=Dendrobium catenatum TaxID=906689 RepID=A0A2I0VL79_9ASPA|nr:hypothetical protein MA16_Dca005092 [Dendrobium catenatum]